VAVPKSELQRRVGVFADTFRRKGLRATHQRMEIFRELAASDDRRAFSSPIYVRP